LTIKICVSILPETTTDALNLIGKVENYKADFIEVRLDRLKNKNGLADITNIGKLPMIATNRSPDSQGKFSGSETERQQILLKAAREGFEYIDIELSTPKLKDIVSALREINVKLIISFHDFDGTPNISKMHDVLQEEIAKGSDICKIVTTARSIEDNLTVLNFLSKACRSAKVVCFCMGKLGKSSRLLSPLFGGFFTIAALEQGQETASGQLTISEMRTAYQALGFV
jgi:3-dehydroquinate dehydratase type I